MDIFNIEDMKGGWFVGNFTPSAHNTEQFEVAFARHHKGQKWDAHYHKKATEINYLIRGKMTIQETTLKAGDIFILKPYEVADPVFLEDCELIVIKTPSVIGDKYAAF